MPEEEKEYKVQSDEADERRSVKDVLVQSLFYIAFFIALVVFLIFSNNKQKEKEIRASAVPPHTTTTSDLQINNDIGVDQ